MNTEDLLTVVNGEDSTKEAIATAVEAFASEQENRYIKKDRETLKFKHALKDVGYDKEKYEGVDDFVTKMSGVLKASETKPTDPVVNAGEESQVALLAAKLKALEQREVDLKKDNEAKTLESKLQESIGKKLKGSKYIVNDLIHSGRVKMVDGDAVFMRDGDAVLYDEGIKLLISENDDLLISPQKSGASTVVNSNGAVPGGLDIDVINKMTPAELAQNIDKIKKLAGIR